MLIDVPFFAASSAFAVSLDPTAPSIVHSTTDEHRPPGEKITVGAEITDTSGIASATLFYRRTGSLAFKQVEMEKGALGRYYGIIPASEVYGSAMEYYIKAVDTVGNVSYMGHEESLLRVALIVNADTDKTLNHLHPVNKKTPFYKKWWVHGLLVLTVLSLAGMYRNSGRGNANDIEVTGDAVIVVTTP